MKSFNADSHLKSIRAEERTEKNLGTEKVPGILRIMNLCHRDQLWRELTSLGVNYFRRFAK